MGEQGPAPPRACGDGVEHVPRFGLRRSVWWSGKAALSPRRASRGTQHPLSQGGVMLRAAWSTNLSCARDVCCQLQRLNCHCGCPLIPVTAFLTPVAPVYESVCLDDAESLTVDGAC